MIRYHQPRVATREVALKESGGRRRFLYSSEVLPLFGFSHGLRFRREIIAGGGFSLQPDATGVQQVYERRYSRSSRRETQIEIGCADFLSTALPNWTERVHITLRPGRIEARPVKNETFLVRKSFRESLDPYSAMVLMSAGVDAHCLSSLGFRIAGHLEWRPPEARDRFDLSESGVMTALANSRPEAVFNEDIRSVDWARVRDLVDNRSPIACFHISLQCDDFSNLKRPAARKASLENLTTTIDLFYDALRAIETFRPVTVLVEQVPAFGSSREWEVFSVRLRRWGYNVSSRIVDPVEYGFFTSRRRFYAVASLFPGYHFPEAAGRNTTPVLEALQDELTNCRDVTHTKTVHEGVRQGFARHLRPGDLSSPTVFKSQARQPKDAVYIALPDGRYLLPSRRMLQRLCEIPDSFSTAHLSDELATETIGQSIAYGMHHKILGALKEHLAECHAGSAGVVISPAKRTPGQQAFNFDEPCT